ncbi:hypothetical protein FPE01S_05_01910 [Flavihumibacter petaseus NBRC 106054]|uniref:Uncharacterized protein n=2 Tax=Flavihumibacter TaxID=1004301 RepID=A0A0E9N723_9BACT|nr:hypothetical protein FPE01S_05_01910 [Flavihumibacter petaseus NBRC 106054]
MKLQVLVAHFMEHQQLDRQLGFIDFLSMHYWGTDLNDHDEERDRQLPFKSFNIQSFQLSFVSTPRTFTLKRAATPVLVKDYPVTDINHLPNPAINALFRPPRA